MIEAIIMIMSAAMFIMLLISIMFAFALLLVKFISWFGGKVLGIKEFDVD